MAIKRKDSATIIPKNYANYNPSTFVKRDNFLEVTAEQALEILNPITLPFIPEPILAVDTETFYTGVPNNNMPSNVVRRWISDKSGKLIPNDFPFCISISDGRYCVAIYDTLKNGFKEFKKLAPLLSNPDIAKCGHNMSYDLHMLANAGVNMAGRFYDTLHLSKLTRAYAFTHNLLDIATEIQDRQPTVTVYEHMLSAYKQLNRITDYRKFPQELMTQYTCADTWNCLHALIELYPLMVAYEQKQLFDLESETMLVTFRMERTGVMIAAEYENVIIPELQKEMDDAERIIYDQAGYRFNINSTQQVYEVMCKLGYGHLMQRKEPTPAMLAKGKFEGNITLDKAEYERLEELGVPLISSIQTYKKAEKLLNTFAYKLFEMRDSQDRVHCNINTMEAKTGRFSISAPSMQNMPRRADSRIRDAFIAPKGYTLYDFDFKAQESLIMTHYSQAPYLLNIVNNGGDIHRAVAAIIYDVPISEVTKQLREIAKSVEFAIVYGAGPDKVKAMTGLTLEEARMAVNTFKNNVPEVNVFIKTANNVIKSKGYIRTVLGRRVYAAHGREYACVNYLCQGCQPGANKVLTTKGYISLQDLKSTDAILTLSGPTTNYKIWQTGQKDTWELQTTNQIIQVSPDHRFGVYYNGEIMYLRLTDLAIGDYLYMPVVKSPSKSEDLYSIHYLMGYAIGDGSGRGHYITVYGGTEKLDILNKLKEVYTDRAEVTINKGSAGLSYQLNIANTATMIDLFGYGWTGETSHNKYIPGYYFTAPTADKIEILKGLWDSDGGYSGESASYTTTSKQLAKDLALLMNSIGIITRSYSHLQYSGEAYRVQVDTGSFVAFANAIGARRPKAKEWLDYKLSTTLRTKVGVPRQLAKDCFDLLYSTDYYKYLPRAEKSAVLRLKNGSASRKSLLTHLIKAGLQQTKVFEILTKGTFTKVQSILNLNTPQPMYDIEIFGEDHSYIAEGLICHNSAADSTKSRMSEIYKFLKANGFKTQMILQVHDSLLQQVADDEADVLLGYLRWLQTERNLFRVTVTVDIAKCEPTWRTKKEIDVPAVKPPEYMLEKAQAYNIWKEGIL